MGSGKSSIGKQLADKLDFKYIDLDSFIENAPQELVSQQQDRFDYLSNEINNLKQHYKEINKLI